jgi:hypothetical protein
MSLCYICIVIVLVVSPIPQWLKSKRLKQLSMHSIRFFNHEIWVAKMPSWRNRKVKILELWEPAGIWCANLGEQMIAVPNIPWLDTYPCESPPLNENPNPNPQEAKRSRKTWTGMAKGMSRESLRPAILFSPLRNSRFCSTTSLPAVSFVRD